MKLILFDDAFKLSANDIARGDIGIKQNENLVYLKQLEQFDVMNIFTKPIITNINEYLDRQSKIFLQKYFQEDVPTSTNDTHNEEFEHIRTLDNGDFGLVTLVRRKVTDIYYVRKSFLKEYLSVRKKIIPTKNMKKILDSLRFPFTVNLKLFYKDSAYIHFILPVLAGGQLYESLQYSTRLSERMARFVASQILLALEYLHFVGLIYRDLKLENILLDHYGYIKLSNFAMCKLITHNRTYTVCGTAEYMAPEVLSLKGYGLAADWWSFGIILYELCYGTTPFYHKDTVQIFNLIVHCDYHMPVHFSKELSDLIKKLLEPDLTKRIGNLHNGIDDIKHHIWFKDVPWLAVINQRILSPLIPFESEKDCEKYLSRVPEPDIMFVKQEDTYSEEFRDF